MIIGIAMGILALILIAIFAAYCYCRKRRGVVANVEEDDSEETSNQYLGIECETVSYEQSFSSNMIAPEMAEFDISDHYFDGIDIEGHDGQVVVDDEMLTQFPYQGIEMESVSEEK